MMKYLSSGQDTGVCACVCVYVCACVCVCTNLPFLCPALICVHQLYLFASGTCAIKQQEIKFKRLLETVEMATRLWVRSCYDAEKVCVWRRSSKPPQWTYCYCRMNMETPMPHCISRTEASTQVQYKRMHCALHKLLLSYYYCIVVEHIVHNSLFIRGMHTKKLALLHITFRPARKRRP